MSPIYAVARTSLPEFSSCLLCVYQEVGKLNIVVYSWSNWGVIITRTKPWGRKARLITGITRADLGKEEMVYAFRHC
jgi:hypothetical protein